MKILPLLAAAFLTLGCGTLSAQVSQSIYPLPGQPQSLSIETAFGFVGITNFVYKSTIGTGQHLDTLYEKAQSDPNILQIVFTLGTGAQAHVKLRTTWEYFTFTSQPNTVYEGQVADPANGAALVGTAGADVIVDPTQPVQITNDHSQLKFFSTAGNAYVINMQYYYNSQTQEYLMLFTAPNNLAPNGGMTKVEPVSPSNPPTY